MGHNRHAIRKCPYGPPGKYNVVFHGAIGMNYLFHGTKEECKDWLKEQIKFLKTNK